MKNKLNLLILILLISSCQSKTNAPPAVQEKSYGHEQGNATDNPPSGYDGAWMLGDEKVIKYCFVASSDFGVNEQKITQDLQAAFQTWKNYIKVKKINDELESHYLGPAVLPPGPVLDERLARAKLFRLSVNSQLMSSCDGTENIKFYFGSEDHLIRSLKAGYFNPTAFAHRIQYDPLTGVGSGVIWIAKKGALGEERGDSPDWTLTNRLLGVILHELGHVFGVGHIDGTIMEENMFGILVKPEWTNEKQADVEYKLSHIDHNVELFYPKIEKNEQIYQGSMDNGYAPVEWETIEHFEFMTGAKPNGKVSAQLQKKKLTLYDGFSKHEFDISLDRQVGYSPGSPIFKANRRWIPDGGLGASGGGIWLGYFSSVTVGEVETKNGTKVPIVLEQNLNFLFPIVLYYIKDGKKEALLRSYYLTSGL